MLLNSRYPLLLFTCPMTLPHLCPNFHHSIVAVTEGLPSYVLLAAHGAGVNELEITPVMIGTQWSAYQMRQQPLGFLTANVTSQVWDRTMPGS